MNPSNSTSSIRLTAFTHLDQDSALLDESHGWMTHHSSKEITGVRSLRGVRVVLGVVCGLWGVLKTADVEVHADSAAGKKLDSQRQQALRRALLRSI